ncbi:hypothetical protein, partial [Bradyrhizobium lablabi]|uniref:hypothetical protein n=1 Tax=Bradyrhizobium lablabi TaxID=722472 RepID=UPI001AECB0E1
MALRSPEHVSGPQSLSCGFSYSANLLYRLLAHRVISLRCGIWSYREKRTSSTPHQAGFMHEA